MQNNYFWSRSSAGELTLGVLDALDMLKVLGMLNSLDINPLPASDT
jgi:hypothetical protein